jgi:hypothetical protein
LQCITVVDEPQGGKKDYYLVLQVKYRLYRLQGAVSAPFPGFPAGMKTVLRVGRHPLEQVAMCPGGKDADCPSVNPVLDVGLAFIS